ncbi:hypothetical protein GCM10007973_07120 [Polymorphobacter multimanifer]|nr:hypothetical protein [Polymorphobacter multimanifer]GGI72731.1 hypothetical protein GCM10007973_07120 [Polymorphobacter multimanifer]
MRTIITLLALALAACNTDPPEAPATGHEAALTANAGADVDAARAEAGL